MPISRFSLASDPAGPLSAFRLPPPQAIPRRLTLSQGNALILMPASRYELGTPCPKFSGLHHGIDIAVRHVRFIFVREALVRKSIVDYLSLQIRVIVIKMVFFDVV